MLLENITQIIDFRDLNRFLSKSTWNSKDLIEKEGKGEGGLVEDTCCLIFLCY